MSEIIIESLLPVVGHVPVNGTDANDRTYTEWALDNAAGFSIVIPTGYVSGEEIIMVFTESSITATKAHKWRYTATVSTFSETHDTSYTSSAIASTITDRSITITTSGTIGSHALLAGDVVSVALSRIAADSNEDSASIRLYSLVANITTSEGPTTSCLGRVGTIVTSVLSIFNDYNQQFITQSDIVGWINECQYEIATRGYWTKTTALNVVANQTEYDLNALIADMESIEGVTWEAEDTSYFGEKRLIPIGTWSAYEGFVQSLPTNARAWAYHLRENVMLLVPVPTASYTAGINIRHTYSPAALACTTSYTPHTPRSHDRLYVDYALSMAFARDRHAPMADQQAMKYSMLAEKGMNKLFYTSGTPGMRLRGGR